MNALRILLAGVAATALAAPAVAEQHTAATDGSTAGEMRWEDVSRPRVSIVRRGADGSVVFGNGTAEDAAPGANDPSLARQIERADGPTTGATDTEEARETAGTIREADAPTMGETDAGDGAGRRMAGDATGEADGMAPDDMASGGMHGEMHGMMHGGMDGFDMEEFAREMFEQGYRQGYVAAMTRARADMGRMRERAESRQTRREQRDQARMRRAAEARAAQQAEATRRMLDGSGGGDAPMRGEAMGGATIIVLPEGMSPQQFVEQLGRQSR
ncbi:hypothetical protein [Jannaschia sp. W003]|uniref:hypothetical protein n=1 Tax=Jannaschia sp. W003 TaxID=2867012 RepID=UPI0021A87971|nr:hypothetical protein [Jannaschia sp. W003]UWQ21071.1 hypothetical protein K3554_14010 [Jannaschia sp. W003]